MITLGREPEGILLKKADVLDWAQGLTDAQWDKIRPHLTAVKVLGCDKPFYRKLEIKRKIINPMLEE
jgi:hypothetical protein